MSQAVVVALAETLILTPVSGARLAQFYDEALLALAQSELIVNAHLVPVTAGTATYALPTDTLVVRTAFFASTELTRAGAPHLDAVSRQWREDTGTPNTWMIEYEQERTLRLYPNPTASSGAMVFPNGEPFGRDYPSNLLCVWSVDRNDAVPAWMDLPMALAIASRELMRSSRQSDAEYVQRAAKLATVLRGKIGPP